jgi:D-amino-acid oxidase
MHGDEYKLFSTANLSPPSSNAPRILVVGAGVIGLTTAWALLEKGYNVTIVAAAKADFQTERLASQIAGAL